MSFAYALAGLLGLCLAWAVVRLVREARQRRALLAWLRDTASAELPDGDDAWREVFSAQRQLQKENRRDLAQLTMRLERFLKATQAIPDGVILLDADDRIEWHNRVAGEQLGIALEEDQGTLIVHLFRYPVFLSYLRRFRGGEATEDGLSLELGTPPRQFLVRLLPVANQGSLLLLRDVTDMVRTERMRVDFVANVSHELRTPVTVISGFLEQMTCDEPPQGEDAKRFLAMMSDQAGRMRRLIEDLLTLSRLEGESRLVSEDEIVMPTMIAELIEEADALSSGRHTVTCGEVEPVNLFGNPEELRSAFANLLSNAIRYTPEWGEITVRWQVHEGKPVFSVQDTGIGIASDHIPRLTERFYRVDRGRSSSSGGTGLGLAIVKHVLSRHGGCIKIDSTPGRGSTFSAMLPAERLRR